MDKEINNNGYDYVDLGLPSGTLWATCNVGASKPIEYGLYFQWGATQGYTKEQVGVRNGQKMFSSNWSDYKWGLPSIFTKYESPMDKLKLEDDAAHAYMGGDWHIPIPYQILELINNTTREWTTLDDVNGMKFTSKKDDSKSIFIPATGYAWGCSVDYSGSFGNIWSSMLDAKCSSYGQSLVFELGKSCLIDGIRRDCGFPIRGVIDGKQNDTKDKKENTIMDKENKAMIDRHNSLKAFDDEIESLQEKIKEIKKKKDACLTDDYSKMYTGKYVRITRKGFPYIKECIYVRSVYTDMDSDKFALKLQGQGFRYIAGDYLDEIEGNFSEIYSTTIFENWLNNGTIKVSLISKDEYKNEVNKMLDFISKDFDDVEVIE